MRLEHFSIDRLAANHMTASSCLHRVGDGDSHPRQQIKIDASTFKSGSEFRATSVMHRINYGDRFVAHLDQLRGYFKQIAGGYLRLILDNMSNISPARRLRLSRFSGPAEGLIEKVIRAIIKHRYLVSPGHMPYDVAHRRMAYPFVYNHVHSL